MAEGQIISDGPAASVLLSVPALAPQVAKVFSPAPILTVDEAVAVLAHQPSGDAR
jgi:energy-coupling factor transport system ATP-binding protein